MFVHLYNCIIVYNFIRFSPNHQVDRTENVCSGLHVTSHQTAEIIGVLLTEIVQHIGQCDIEIPFGYRH